VDEPINIVFGACDPAWEPISNLAPTPFSLDGRRYASVEGFWQGLKFADDMERIGVAALWGMAAKQAGAGRSDVRVFDYAGVAYEVGSPRHQALMRRACAAKFMGNDIAREALLATGERMLVHRVAVDSRTIPGVVMAAIWMELRYLIRTRTCTSAPSASSIVSR